jgi:hypothetical protein
MGDAGPPERWFFEWIQISSRPATRLPAARCVRGHFDRHRVSDSSASPPHGGPRTKEIAQRKVLGSRRAGIMRLLMWHSANCCSRARVAAVLGDEPLAEGFARPLKQLVDVLAAGATTLVVARS